MSKRPSQGSPTSHRSFKKQKVSPPSPPPKMSTFIIKDQHAPVLSEVSTSSAAPNFSPTAPNSFGTFGQPSSSSRLGFSEGNLTKESKGWTKVEKRKDKKKRKEEQKTLSQPASFAFNLEDLKQRDFVTIADIRELSLHLIGDASPPSWLRVTNRPSIKRVVVLMVPGITNDTFDPPLQKQDQGPLFHIPAATPEAKIPFLSTFLHAVPTRAPGDPHHMHSVVQGFFMGPITGEEKKLRITNRIKNEREKLPPLTSYVLTPEQMIENEYPTPAWVSDVFDVPEGWLQVPAPDDGTQDRVLALDCEMCLTENGKELARACIIDYASGKKLYDQLVKPTAPVTDYLTRFSGITEEKLANVSTRLIPDVHDALRELITPNTILLGHSLESDLRALHLAHGRCIDTSVIYHHPRGRPLKPGLAWLTKKWANREIQTGGESGHDPEEDARASIDLLKLKVKNGPGFGEFAVDMESILERMARRTAGNGGVSISGGVGGGIIRTGVVDYGTPSSWMGAKATSTVACKCDEDVAKGVAELVTTHQFVFGRMMELSGALKWTTPKNSAATTTPAPETPTKDTKEVYSTLDSNLTFLYKALPPATAFILFTGHSDPRKMSDLSKRKNGWDQLLREGNQPEQIPREEWWTTEAGRLLEDEVELAKRGLLFVGLKHA